MRDERFRIRSLPLMVLTLAGTTALAAAEEPAPADGVETEKRAVIREQEQREEDEVVVTGRKRMLPLPELNVPLDHGASRDILGPEHVRDIPVWSIEEIANRLPGVSSRLYSGDEYIRPSISARGMPDNGFSEYIGVHVDGLNYSRLFYGWTALSQFPVVPENIYAAEVYRGGQAVRFGPTTLGGVVNFITTPIPDRNQVGLRTTLGEHGFQSTKWWVGGTDPKTGVGYLLTHVARSGDTWRDQSDFRLNDTSAKVLVPTGEDSWLSIHSFYWRDIHALMGRLTRAQLDDDPAQNTNHPEVRWSGWNYGNTVTWHRDATATSWYEVQIYDRFGHQNLPSMRPAAPPFTAFRNQVIDTNNRGIYLRGEAPVYLGVEHVLHAGIRYHKENITRDIYDTTLVGGTVTRSSDVRVDTRALSVHLDDTVRFNGFTANAGVRYENILDSEGHDSVSGNDRDFSFDDVMYGASLSYTFNEYVAAFTNYHESFRAPQTWSYDFTNLDQDMTFEHGNMAEIGVRSEDWNGLSSSLVRWRNRTSDFIEFDSVTSTYRNLGRFEAEGTDLTLHADGGAIASALHGWSAWSTYTWQDAEFRSGTFDNKDSQHVPHRFWRGGIRYDHTRSGFYGTLDFNSKSQTAATPANFVNTPGYTTFNARVGWRREYDLTEKRKIGFDVALSALNVTNRDYHLRHNKTLYVPGNPRTVFMEFGITVDI